MCGFSTPPVTTDPAGGGARFCPQGLLSSAFPCEGPSAPREAADLGCARLATLKEALDSHHVRGRSAPWTGRDREEWGASLLRRPGWAKGQRVKGSNVSGAGNFFFALGLSV